MYLFFDTATTGKPKNYKATLSELHTFLFKCDFEGAHDAMDDVNATAKCFFELKKQELIKL